MKKLQVIKPRRYPVITLRLTFRLIALNVLWLINETATAEGMLSGLHFMTFSTHVREFLIANNSTSQC
jgi:hypothetical protein